MNEQELNKLNQNIEDLNKFANSLTSYTRRFLLGVAQGVGSAIGATIVAGIILILLSRFFSTVVEVPTINNFLQNIQLQESVNPISPGASN